MPAQAWPEHPAVRARADALTDRLLHGVLWLTVASGFFVFIQPAPYEFMFGLLVFACFLAGVAIDIKVLPLLFLMTMRDATAIPSLFGVLERSHTLSFFAISVYLGLTATVFACIFAQDTMRRIATLRSAYVFAGVFGTILGMIGYFNLLPGFQQFVLNDRVVSGFKDPNVYGPFLIAPMLWTMQGFVTDRIRFWNVIWAMVLAAGILLAYSRAAWIAFVLVVALMVWLLFVTAPDRASRRRIVMLALTATGLAVALFVVLMAIEQVREMLLSRFGLQSYDTGTEGSRINTQKKALEAIVDYPLGMGPWEFLRINRLAAHNSIMGIALNLGWIAGFCWIAHLVLTIGIGFRCLLVRTPWQPFLVATYAAFMATHPISFVIDTDHWRHYYLLVGIVWGLSIATINHQRKTRRSLSAEPDGRATGDAA